MRVWLVLTLVGMHAVPVLENLEQKAMNLSKIVWILWGGFNQYF